jgi:hypothetical protein
VISFGPAHLEPHHPDLFWYGVHPTEALFAILGLGVRGGANGHGDTDVVTGVWSGGRVGTLVGLRGAPRRTGSLCLGSKAVAEQAGGGDYAPLMRRSSDSFERVWRRFRPRKPSSCLRSWRRRTRASDWAANRCDCGRVGASAAGSTHEPWAGDGEHDRLRNLFSSAARLLEYGGLIYIDRPPDPARATWSLAGRSSGRWSWCLLVGGAGGREHVPVRAATDRPGPGAVGGRARAAEVPANGFPESAFTERAAAAGIDFVHTNGAYGDKLLPETMGGGVAFWDYDNDGDQDLVLLNSGHWPWHDPGAGAGEHAGVV